jgi:hypothetical protein
MTPPPKVKTRMPPLHLTAGLAGTSFAGWSASTVGALGPLC